MTTEAGIPTVSSAAEAAAPALDRTPDHEFRRLRRVLRATVDCSAHPVPGTSVHPRLAGKDGRRHDLFAAACARGASPRDASARVTAYCILHLCASEARLCYPPKGYADLVACGDVLEHLLAVLSPGAANDVVTRNRLGRGHGIAAGDWAQAHHAASRVVERCRMIAQLLRPAAGLSGKAPSTQDWTDTVVNYVAHYIQGRHKVAPP